MKSRIQNAVGDGNTEETEGLGRLEKNLDPSKRKHRKLITKHVVFQRHGGKRFAKVVSVRTMKAYGGKREVQFHVFLT